MKNEDSSDGDGGRIMGLPVQPPKPGKAMSIFVLVVGLAIVGVGVYAYMAESASLDGNVEVTAEVTGTSVERAGATRGTESYAPVVTFQYSFRGERYTADNIYPGVNQPQYEDRSTARSHLSDYTVGESVPAYVDPDTPGEAYLEDSRSGQAIGGVVVGLLVALLGAIGLYQGRRQARNRERLS